MLQMPKYQRYCTVSEAAGAERTFRRALGLMLKRCGDQLLTVAEAKSAILGGDQQQLIEDLVGRISAIFRRLDRDGVVCLIGDCEATISELEELDMRLILLIEEALELVWSLSNTVQTANWFKLKAPLLCRDLAAFSEATEERNYLLGLGWESEFTWNGRE